MIPSIQRELSNLRVQDLVRDAEQRSTHRGGRTSTRRPGPRTGREER